MRYFSAPIEQLGRIYHFHHRKNIVDNIDYFAYHHHVFCEIYLLCNGDAEFIIEDSIYPLEKDDILVIPPYKIHSTKPKPGTNLERIVLNIFPSFFAEMSCQNYIDVISRFSETGHLIKNNIGRAYMLQELLHSLDQSFNNDYNASNILPNLKIVELIYNLYRLLESDVLETSTPETPLNNPIISEVIKYINTNYATITNVSSISSAFNYSPNYLNKIFKQSTGMTIPKYVNIKRFENVENLFRAGNSLEYASTASGFNNYRHFAYAYKQEYGISPKTGMKL